MTAIELSGNTHPKRRRSDIDAAGSGPDSVVAAPRSPMLEIANAMVHIYKEAFGRGPTKARAQMAGPDTLVVILENSLTAAERNLARLGEHERLRESRLFLQHALEDEFRAPVEKLLGRRTRAVISGIDTRRDVAVEVFTLEPEQEPEPEQEQRIV
jgi:uncharacterized protein YbcI